MIDQSSPPGHVFFAVGDVAERAFHIHAGEVELLARAGDSWQRAAMFGPGDVFGELALIAERPRAYAARAVTDVRAVSMTREEFERLLTDDPVQARPYLRTLFERLRMLTEPAGGNVQLALPEPTPPPTSLAVVEPLPIGPVELSPGLGKASEWIIVLHPLTRKAAETLPDEGLLVSRFPLRIGRVTGASEPEALDLNDLWLLDERPYSVSRNHCEICIDRQGPIVRDRGSQMGCYVNEQWIGGRSDMGYAPLDLGENVVVVGGRSSKYQFRVNVGRKLTETARGMHA